MSSLSKWSVKKNYCLLKEVKRTWDPENIFNPNKIVDTPPMDTMLRYVPGQQTPAFKTIFRFHNQDVLQHAEQCNGSGDCRKTQLSGGTMCPSFMATSTLLGHSDLQPLQLRHRSITS